MNSKVSVALHHLHLLNQNVDCVWCSLTTTVDPPLSFCSFYVQDEVVTLRPIHKTVHCCRVIWKLLLMTVVCLMVSDKGGWVGVKMHLLELHLQQCRVNCITGTWEIKETEFLQGCLVYTMASSTLTWGWKLCVMSILHCPLLHYQYYIYPCHEQWYLCLLEARRISLLLFYFRRKPH